MKTPFLIRNLLAILLFGFVLNVQGQTGSEEEYDYIDPELVPEKPHQSGVSLPIKSQSPMVAPVPRQSFQQQDVVNEDFDRGTPEETEPSKQRKTSVGVELGSSVTSDFHGNTAINTYAAPHISHELSENVTVSGGVIMSKTFLNGWTNYSFEGGPVPSSIMTNSIYGRIDYRINDRTTVYGAVYKSITALPSGYQNNGALDGTGFAAGMTYKVSDHSFLQIQVQRSQGYNPFSPYGNCGAYGMGGFGSYGTGGFGGRPFSYFP